MDSTHLSSYNYAWNSLCEAINVSSIFDSERRQPHSRCMENTRVALLARISHVLDQSDRANIWLNGLAGVGKSSIAFTIAEKMKAAKRLAATFFFSHNRDATAVIPTIAYQLALAFPQIREDIVRAIEMDKNLLLPDKSRDDQMRELVIIPLGRLQFRKEPYAIVIDALDEISSTEDAARLVTLLTRTFSGPRLPTIHLVFTSRPVMKIRENMPPGVLEISLTTDDRDTIQDVHFFLRESLDKIRMSHHKLFHQRLIPSSWPSDSECRALISKAGGLFIYAAMAVTFISAGSYDPQDRLNILLREESTVSEDIDQLYRQIMTSSGNPGLHCRILASISCLHEPLPLLSLQELFQVDRRGLLMTLESFSPVILNPPDGNGDVQIYHASLRDFMKDPLRSKEYHVDDADSNERLAYYCIDLLIRWDPAFCVPPKYASISWSYHLSRAYPSRRLRRLLALFARGKLQSLVGSVRSYDDVCSLLACLCIAKKTCFSLKWIRRPSDIVAAWRITRSKKKVQESWESYRKTLQESVLNRRESH